MDGTRGGAPDGQHEGLWERYMRVERKELEDRREGELAKVLGPALPGESQEEIDRFAREDREKAEEGLVPLQEGEELWYRHIDELTREDRPARIEAQRRRLEWVQRRLKSMPHEALGPAPTGGNSSGSDYRGPEETSDGAAHGEAHTADAGEEGGSP